MNVKEFTYWNIISFLFFSVVIIVGISCGGGEPERPTLLTPPTASGPGVFEINLLPRVRGQEFESGLSYENLDTNTIVIDEWRLYMSDIRIVSAALDTLRLADVLLWDFADENVREVQHGEGVFKQFEVPAGNYIALLFSIGIPERMNHENPDNFDPSNPLHPSQQMYWNRSAGYQFIRLAGEIDTTRNHSGGSDMALFEYVLGLDDLFSTVILSEENHAFEVQSEIETQFSLEVDLLAHFYSSTDTIKMKDHLTISSIPPGSSSFLLSKQMMDNFSLKGFFKLPF